MISQINQVSVEIRRSWINCLIVGTQKFNALSPLIRVNATELYVYRLRNYKDLETFVEDVSAVVSGDKKLILEIYNMATSAPYSFLFVNLRAKDKNELFMIKFNQKIMIED